MTTAQVEKTWWQKPSTWIGLALIAAIGLAMLPDNDGISAGFPDGW